jgi:1-acyl-sn-glycerol-3-phosphate acyltransferase
VQKNKIEDAPKLYLFGRGLFRIMFRFLFRWKISGQENIPLDQAAIIAPNHTSFFDPPLAGSAMRRPLNFMAKQELFDVPVLGFLIKRTNAFPVKRGAGDTQALRHAFALLKEGRLLLMFPEGTRSKDGNLGKARAGVGMVSCVAQAPVVPVKIKGTFKMSLFRPVQIAYGKPIYPPKNYTKDDYLKLSQQVVSEIEKMDFSS